MKCELPSLPRQSLLALLIVSLLGVYLSGCKPGNRTLCRSLGELAESHNDSVGDDWQMALDVALTDEESCLEYLDSIAEAHSQHWEEISLCYVRSREWSDVVTCDRVVATLDVSEVCYHLLELDRPVDEAEGEEATDRRTVEYARRSALADCVDEERVKYRNAPAGYAEYTECVLDASTSEEATACSVVEEGDDVVDEESPAEE